MDQILHIFKKDARHLWPEIVISLALLAWYTHRQLQPWPEGTQAVISGGLFFYQIARFVTPALILFWAYLIVRVVQSESLVGDRQWWTTKPYVWWHLFLAKILFMFVFISVPLFHVQLFLLHHFRFPILSHLVGPHFLWNACEPDTKYESISACRWHYHPAHRLRLLDG
jgi:hypothetical protein